MEEDRAPQEPIEPVQSGAAGGQEGPDLGTVVELTEATEGRTGIQPFHASTVVRELGESLAGADGRQALLTYALLHKVESEAVSQREEIARLREELRDLRSLLSEEKEAHGTTREGRTALRQQLHDLRQIRWLQNFVSAIGAVLIGIGGALSQASTPNQGNVGIVLGALLMLAAWFTPSRPSGVEQ